MSITIWVCALDFPATSACSVIALRPIPAGISATRTRRCSTSNRRSMLAEELAHPYSRALALAYAAMLYQFRRETHLAREAAETAIGLCQEQGFAYYLAWVTIMRGWALTAQKQGEEGRLKCDADWARYGATGARLRATVLSGVAGRGVRRRTGEVEAAVKMLAEGLGAAHHHGECWQEAELYRLKGELLIGRHDPRASRSQPGGCQTIDTQVERCFHEALGDRSSSARQVFGVACCHEPREAVAAPRESAPTLTICWRRSTSGLLKDSTRPTFGTPRRCWGSWDRLIRYWLEYRYIERQLHPAPNSAGRFER